MHKESKYSDSKYLGMRQGHLTVTGYDAGKFICLCDCGNEKRIAPIKFLSGKVKSCGYNCGLRFKVNTEDYSKQLRSIWNQMIYRCNNPKSPAYALLHANNINVCQEWKDDFREFYQWAIEKGYQPGLCLTRVTWKRDYSPENCKWVNREEITYRHWKSKGRYAVYPVFGECLTMAQIKKKYNVSEAFIKNRMNKGLTIEEAITIPKYSRLTPSSITQPTP